jgi:hypothetical protein
MTDNPNAPSVLTPDEVDKYLRDNVDGYVGWFWAESDRYERNMKRYELGAIIATVLTTVVAAFPAEYFFGPEPVLKWLVVAISGVATFCTTMRSRHGLEELYRLREEGRVRLAAMQQKARLKLTQVPMTMEERYKYQEGIIEEIARIERDYGRIPAAPQGDGLARGRGRRRGAPPIRTSD